MTTTQHNNDHNELEQGLLDSMKEFEGMLETNNDHAAALELWTAMGEIEGLRPEGIELYLGKWMHNPMLNVPAVPLRLPHALFILTGHAERWLQRPERWGQWDKSWACNGKSFYWDMGEVVKKGAHCSLPAAIRAEIGMGSNVPG